MSDEKTVERFAEYADKAFAVAVDAALREAGAKPDEVKAACVAELVCLLRVSADYIEEQILFSVDEVSDE